MSLEALLASLIFYKNVQLNNHHFSPYLPDSISDYIDDTPSVSSDRFVFTTGVSNYERDRLASEEKAKEASSRGRGDGARRSTDGERKVDAGRRDTEETARIKETIKKYFPENYEVAIAIATAESGLNPNAINTKNRNGTIDRGVFQINSCHLAVVDGDADRLFDVETNVKVARMLYDGGSWNHWSVFKTGAYKKYL